MGFLGGLLYKKGCSWQSNLYIQEVINISHTKQKRKSNFERIA